jgi:hypothetical protein
MILARGGVVKMRQPYSNELWHYGILGMKWGVRRFQNPDGTVTSEGRKRYRDKMVSMADDAYGYKTHLGRQYMTPYEHTKKVEKEASSFIKPTWDKDKLISLVSDIREKQDYADKLGEVEWNKMTADDEWRKEIAQKRANGDKDTFDYLYNLGGIDAADYMSSSWNSDPRHQPEGKRAEDAALKAIAAERAYEDYRAKEVNKAMRSIGINDFNTNKTQQHYVARLLSSAISNELYVTENAYKKYIDEHPDSNMTLNEFSKWYKGGS